ncbi:MAG: hypothetical protein JNJ52_09295 [Flavobacterium sp.]|nr:hypothetical protein [Flavobacterium sp.]
MSELQLFLREYVIYSELVCLIIGLVHYSKVKNTHWVWLVYYIGVIFILESISNWGLETYPNYRANYYAFLVIPIQFVFLYWLYAWQSHQTKKVFYVFLVLYFFSLWITNCFDFHKNNFINFSSYAIGVLLLLYLVIVEFFKQIRSDDILRFSSHKMFYINIAVALFYVGTLPFFLLDGILRQYKEIWYGYYTLFLLLNYVYYGLIGVSFIWGKPR